MEPQLNPDDWHDRSEHDYDPDEKGVCRVCGWWDPNGDTCPGCGKPWSQHVGLILIVGQRPSFMPGTHASYN